MSIAELPPLAATPAERVTRPWQDDVSTIDHELGELRRVMAAARNNSWREGDSIEPEFEKFLAAVTRQGSMAADEALVPTWSVSPSARNAWRDTIEAWDQVVAS